ncbi:MAG: hypothetical protein QNJ88_07105 [Acidimicrobiia bacterium]|nr:hypothetical protein [Acidimicrobiia bacterium]
MVASGRIFLIGLCVIALVFAACTSDPTSGPLPEPVKVETCDGLVPVGETYVRRMVLALDGLSLDVLTGDAEPPADVAALIQLGTDLDLRASRLGCDAAELNADIVAATDDLEAADDPVVDLFLGIVRSGVVGELPPSPPTTPTTTAVPES